MANLVCMADKDKKTKTAGAKLDEETYDLLESIAAELDRSKSWILGKALEEWLVKEGYRNPVKPGERTKRRA